MEPFSRCKVTERRSKKCLVLFFLSPRKLLDWMLTISRRLAAAFSSHRPKVVTGRGTKPTPRGSLSSYLRNLCSRTFRKTKVASAAEWERES